MNNLPDIVEISLEINATWGFVGIVGYLVIAGVAGIYIISAFLKGKP